MEARDACVAAFDRAYKALPDFRCGDFVHAKNLVHAIPALRAEAAEASRDAHPPPGSGSKASLQDPGQNQRVLSVAGSQPRACSPKPVRPGSSRPSFRCSEGIS